MSQVVRADGQVGPPGAAPVRRNRGGPTFVPTMSLDSSASQMSDDNSATSGRASINAAKVTADASRLSRAALSDISNSTRGAGNTSGTGSSAASASAIGNMLAGDGSASKLPRTRSRTHSLLSVAIPTNGSGAPAISTAAGTSVPFFSTTSEPVPVRTLHATQLQQLAAEFPNGHVVLSPSEMSDDSPRLPVSLSESQTSTIPTSASAPPSSSWTLLAPSAISTLPTAVFLSFGPTQTAAPEQSGSTSLPPLASASFKAEIGSAGAGLGIVGNTHAARGGLKERQLPVQKSQQPLQQMQQQQQQDNYPPQPLPVEQAARIASNTESLTAKSQSLSETLSSSSSSSSSASSPASTLSVLPSLFAVESSEMQSTRLESGKHVAAVLAEIETGSVSRAGAAAAVQEESTRDDDETGVVRATATAKATTAPQAPKGESPTAAATTNDAPNTDVLAASMVTEHRTFAMLTGQDPAHEYEDDVYATLVDAETVYAPRPDYMTSVQADVTPQMRSILVDWLVEVAQEYRLGTQTLFLAVHYVDRLLSLVPVNRTKLQLVGITAILVAAKYDEVFAPMIDQLVYISDNTYQRFEVLRMETILLTTLGFGLATPTAYEFCCRYCRAGNVKGLGHTLAVFIAECALQETVYITHRPSAIAASAVLTARFILLTHHLFAERLPSAHPTLDLRLLPRLTPDTARTYVRVAWPETLTMLTGFSASALSECVSTMVEIFTRTLGWSMRGSGGGSEGAQLKAVTQKYSTAEFDNVAMRFAPPIALTANILHEAEQTKEQ